jgi:c-di-GMP-binding flagellar brake protein YcgR
MASNRVELIDEKKNIFIETGTDLSLTVEGFDSSVQSTFVGKKSDQYIVITPPSEYNTIVKKLLQADQIKIKYLFKGDIFEFKSKLTEISHTPLLLLLLQCPASVEKLELRGQKRISCFISAEVEINNEMKNGVIKDISKSGCRCVFEASKKVEETVRIDDFIALNFSFPGIVDRQEIFGRIKDIQIKDGKLDMGIEFESIAWWVPPYD